VAIYLLGLSEILESTSAPRSAFGLAGELAMNDKARPARDRRMGRALEAGVAGMLGVEARRRGAMA